MCKVFLLYLKMSCSYFISHTIFVNFREVKGGEGSLIFVERKGRAAWLYKCDLRALQHILFKFGQ